MTFNLLLVDDSRTVRAVIKKALRLAKVPTAEIFHAGNGQEALDIIAENWIDLVFADINMPVMNGVEMIEKLKESEVTESIPVVVISTEGSTTRIEELKQKGVSAYIRKPFQPEQLRDIVMEILGESDE